MRRAIIGIVLLGIVVLASSLAFSQRGGEEKGHGGVLSVLSKGQAVSLKEVSGRYEIGIIPEAMLGCKVVEVGADYVVVKDIAGVTELHIPIYSIKAVSILKATG
jgi:hypothetical protein